MATVNVTGEGFDDLVESADTVFVDFWASWCQPCLRFGPVYEAVSEQHPNAVFAKLDTEANNAFATSLGITGIPTLMAFRGGVLVFSQAGALPKPAFEDLVSKVEALDLDEVKASAAAAD